MPVERSTINVGLAQKRRREAHAKQCRFDIPCNQADYRMFMYLIGYMP